MNLQEIFAFIPDAPLPQVQPAAQPAPATIAPTKQAVKRDRSALDDGTVGTSGMKRAKGQPKEQKDKQNKGGPKAVLATPLKQSTNSHRQPSSGQYHLVNGETAVNKRVNRTPRTPPTSSGKKGPNNGCMKFISDYIKTSTIETVHQRLAMRNQAVAAHLLQNRPKGPITYQSSHVQTPNTRPAFQQSHLNHLLSPLTTPMRPYGTTGQPARQRGSFGQQLFTSQVEPIEPVKVAQPALKNSESFDIFNSWINFDGSEEVSTPTKAKKPIAQTEPAISPYHFVSGQEGPATSGPVSTALGIDLGNGNSLLESKLDTLDPFDLEETIALLKTPIRSTSKQSCSSVAKATSAFTTTTTTTTNSTSTSTAPTQTFDANQETSDYAFMKEFLDESVLFDEVEPVLPNNSYKLTEDLYDLFS